MKSSFRVTSSRALFQVVVKLMDDAGVDSIDKISPMFTPDQRDPRASVLFVSSGDYGDDHLHFLSMVENMKGVFVHSLTHVSDNFIFGYGIDGSEDQDK